MLVGAGGAGRAVAFALMDLDVAMLVIHDIKSAPPEELSLLARYHREALYHGTPIGRGAVVFRRRWASLAASTLAIERSTDEAAVLNLQNVHRE